VWIHTRIKCVEGLARLRVQHGLGRAASRRVASTTFQSRPGDRGTPHSFQPSRGVGVRMAEAISAIALLHEEPSRSLHWWTIMSSSCPRDAHRDAMKKLCASPLNQPLPPRFRRSTALHRPRLLAIHAESGLLLRIRPQFLDITSSQQVPARPFLEGG